MWRLFVAAMPLFAQMPEPPGRLIDIGGRKLHLHCTGSGAPAVILEAGASSFAIDWSLVQPEIAKAGPVDTPGNIVQDLRAVLRA